MKLTTGLLKRIIEEEIQKLSEEHEGLDSITGGSPIVKPEADETEADKFADALENKKEFHPSMKEAAELKRIRAAKKLKLRESALENELKKVRAIRAKIIKSLI
jgi:hypothetical protein